MACFLRYLNWTIFASNKFKNYEIHFYLLFIDIITVFARIQ